MKTIGNGLGHATSTERLILVILFIVCSFLSLRSLTNTLLPEMIEILAGSPASIVLCIAATAMYWVSMVGTRLVNFQFAIKHAERPHSWSTHAKIYVLSFGLASLTFIFTFALPANILLAFGLDPVLAVVMGIGIALLSVLLLNLP